MRGRGTDGFFWPALIGAWTGLLIGVLAVVMPPVFSAWVLPVTAVLALLAVVMFGAAVIDGPTRRAVAAFNIDQKEKWRGRTWWERLVSLDYGDRRLVLVNRLVWVEGIVFIVMRRPELALVCFVSFALSTLMLMLLMKRREGVVLVSEV